MESNIGNFDDASRPNPAGLPYEIPDGTVGGQDVVAIPEALPGQAETHERREALALVHNRLVGLLGKNTEVARTYDTKESLEGQLPAAYEGYRAAVGFLNEGGSPRKQVPVAGQEELRAEFEEWLTDDKVAYVAAVQDADPDVGFTLVATPNTLVGHKRLIKATEAFGRHMAREAEAQRPKTEKGRFERPLIVVTAQEPFRPSVQDILYTLYTPQQLSGTQPENGRSFTFSLIPDRYALGMVGTIVEQKQALAERQVTYPFLKVPSVLESFAYWQTRRVVHKEYGQHDTSPPIDQTAISHFDLPERRAEGWVLGTLTHVERGTGVPMSAMGNLGKPLLSMTDEKTRTRVRIAVG